MDSITQSPTNLNTFVSPLDVNSRRAAIRSALAALRQGVYARLLLLPDDALTAWMRECMEAELLIAEHGDDHVARLIGLAAEWFPEEAESSESHPR